MADGQTIGIAGLLSENVRDVVGEMPGFSDIPILGQLFNSQDYTSNETELVILVTPRLATSGIEIRCHYQQIPLLSHLILNTIY